MQEWSDKRQGSGRMWRGRSVRRVEDGRLLTGAGRFVDDIRADACLHLEFLRSSHAAGDIIRLDVTKARESHGVVAVFMGIDVADLGSASVNALLPDIRISRFPVLAHGRVDAVGQSIVAVVAQRQAQARDAIECIDIDLATRPIDGAATQPPAITHRWASGDVEAAFAAATTIARVRVEHARLAPAALEPRASLATWDPAGDGLTVWLSTQTPHRARLDFAQILGLPAARIRVIAPDVGGAFGGKASIYPEEVMVAWAAMRLGRPVKWCATRSDDLLAATQGRGATTVGELALDAEGRMLGLRAHLAFPLGHWLPYSAAAPGRNAGRILPGPYRILATDVSLQATQANTAAVNIYRGAGRPEAAMLMERLVDEAARILSLDPIEIRRRNLLGPDVFPFRAPSGAMLDSGDYPALLRMACTRSGYLALRQQHQQRRARDDIVGLGLAMYVEPCGEGWESATVSLADDGGVIAATGSSAQGQGRETAYAQIVADALGISFDKVVVKAGDTGVTPPGIGALASRSTAIGGSAMLRAAQAFAASARKMAAALLQCPEHGVVAVADGFVALQGDDQHITWQAIAASVRDEGRGVLSESVVFHADGEAWSSGCCVAAVRIDRETGTPTVEQLTWVDDAGIVINPMLVDGQLVGGMAQGIGEALLERLVYDGDGQLLTGSLMDYAMPRATDIPAVDIHKMVTPSPANALGAKGVGEAGCIGVPAAIVNAVVNALAPFGVTHMDMPLTSQKIWQAMQAAPTHIHGATGP